MNGSASENPNADILAVADAYIAAAKFRPTANKETSTSSRAFNDGKKLGELRRGEGITKRREVAALRWFSEHWPEGAEWPSEVRRPAVSAPEGDSKAAVEMADA